jgi:L-fuconolactonase
MDETFRRRALTSMNIDAHQHFWRYDPIRDSWITAQMSVIRRDFMPEDLLPELRLNQMDGCVAVQADQSEAETLFLLELATQHDEIKGVVGWADLCAQNLPERLQYFSQFDKLCGFRHIAQSEPDDRFLIRNDLVAGVRQLQQFGFSYDILIYPRQLPAARELVERLPDQRFVLDHLAKPFIRTQEISDWAHQIRAIAESPKVHCKVSGFVTEADWKNWRFEDFRPYLDVVFEAFGADRVMFGSDWPVCLVAASYAQVKQLIAVYIQDLPRAQQQKIFGLNAISFYGLKTSNHEPATAR